MEQRKPRLACYDRMKVIAVLGVMMGTISNILVNQEAAERKALGFTWHLANLMDCAAQFAVPLILMMVGALLLQKEESADFKAVLHRRVWYLFIPLSVWTLVYFLFRLIYSGVLKDGFVAVDAIRSLLHTPVVSHLWLFYLLLALYLLVPFLRLLVQYAPRKLILYGVVLWFIYNSLWPALSALWPVLALPSYGNLSMMGGYVGYLLLGWLLATTEQVPSPTSMAVGWGVLSVLTAIFTALLTKEAGEANLVLCSPLMPNVVLMGVCAFLFCRAFDRPTVFSPWLSPMAQVAFGVYAVHELFVLLLTPLIRLIPGVVSLLFAPILVGIASLIVVAFLRQTPVTRLLFMGRHGKP